MLVSLFVDNHCKSAVNALASDIVEFLEENPTSQINYINIDGDESGQSRALAESLKVTMVPTIIYSASGAEVSRDADITWEKMKLLIQNTKKAVVTHYKSEVLELEVAAELKQLVEARKDCLIAVYFTHQQSENSKRLSPIFTQVAANYRDVVFVRLASNDHEGVGGMFGIKHLPSCNLYFNAALWSSIDEQSLSVTHFSNEIQRKIKEFSMMREKPGAGIPGAVRGGGFFSLPVKGGGSNHASSEKKHLINDESDSTMDAVALPPAPMQPVHKHQVKHAVVRKTTSDDPDKKPDFIGILEECCTELQYSPEKIVQILDKKEYPDELLDLMMSKTCITDKNVIIEGIEMDRADLLQRMKKLVIQMKKEKSEKERRIQEKCRVMGMCCMGYEWLKIDGGYQCAGGSHFLNDKDLAD